MHACAFPQSAHSSSPSTHDKPPLIAYSDAKGKQQEGRKLTQQTQSMRIRPQPASESLSDDVSSLLLTPLQ